MNCTVRNKEFKSHSRIKIFAPYWEKCRNSPRIPEVCPVERRNELFTALLTWFLYQLKSKRRHWRSSSICCRLKQAKKPHQNGPLKCFPLIIYNIGRVLLSQSSVWKKQQNSNYSLQQKIRPHASVVLLLVFHHQQSKFPAFGGMRISHQTQLRFLNISEYTLLAHALLMALSGKDDPLEKRV